MLTVEKKKKTKSREMMDVISYRNNPMVHVLNMSL